MENEKIRLMKIEILDENGRGIGLEPLRSEEEQKEYIATRKMRKPDNYNEYLYPLSVLNPIVIDAHRRGLEFRQYMAARAGGENKAVDVNENTAENTVSANNENAPKEDEESGENDEKDEKEILSEANADNSQSNNAECGTERTTEGFRTQCSKELEISKLTDFPNNKFSVYEGGRLEDMAESIRRFGVLTPLVVWKKDDGYIILSGHNRKRAAELAGFTSVPVCIKENLTDDEANLIMGETNFRQRGFSEMKHSQKAFCLKQHYTIMKKVGIKNDVVEAIETQNFLQKNNADFVDGGAENSSGVTIEPQLKSKDIVAKEYQLSSAMVVKYIRMADLCSELLELLDNGKIAFNSAYQLTFIENEEFQKIIAEVIENGTAIETVKACKLREYYEKHKNLTEERVKEILEKRPKRNDAIIIKPKDINRFFTGGENKAQMKNIIIAALEMYFAKKKE